MKPNRLEKMEALRGFAALYVVLFHLLPQKIFLGPVNIGFLFRFGPEAVIVFFALSGFVIKYTWERSADKSFGFYFIRRFIRLYIPLFFIFIMGYAIQCYQTGSWADTEWKSLIGNLLMLQDVISQKPNVVTGAYMGNGVLWSLSYEWWFYMLFFFLSTRIPADKLNKWVAVLTAVAAVSYLIYPFIVNRLLMYFAIWWTGVRIAELYLKKEPITYKSMLPHFGLLTGISLILGLNLYLHFSYTKVYTYPLVAYPFVELRHFVFTVVVLFAAILWKNLNWIGYKQFLEPFKYLAPFSYVIYISHHYLVIEATYLSFIPNKIVEYTLYILLMLGFSWLLEVKVYNWIRKKILK